MEEQTQSQSAPVQPAPTPQISEKRNIKPLIIVATFVFLVMTGALVYLGYQNYQLQQQIKQLRVTTASEAETKSGPTGARVEKSTIVPLNPNCASTFTSKILQLSFEYDECVWRLEENLSEEAGIYSVITATNKNSHKLLIKAEAIGMGGNYPGCYKVNDVSIFENNIVRVQLSDNNNYYYLNEKNDYAIKNYSGEFGDKKFNEYFTFLNPNAFPDTNMCWRNSGINPVRTLGPKEGFEANKDITISIENPIPLNDEFLQAADSLAVSVYSEINQ